MVPILIDEVLPYGINVGVWCAMSATRIILCVCVSINYTYSDTVFEHTNYERTCASFQQHDATAHITNNCSPI